MRDDAEGTATGHAVGGATTATPSISLPRGGGAIRGIGEKFATNPVTGTGALTVPIATSPGRSGFGPALALRYDSGAGNGPFGFGWSLALPAISRKTDQGLPRYDDGTGSDTFVLSGSEDLVPVLVPDGAGGWVPEELAPRTVAGTSYRIRRYRPRIEGLFARIERWTSALDPAETFWRSISRDNITTWYGRSADSRIADPEHPERIFSWLICESHDDRGNAIVYGYRREDSARVLEDAAGNRLVRAHERNRTERGRSAQRYLKRIRYGNRVPHLPELGADAPWPEPAGATAADGAEAWHFEVVLDYGEHDGAAPAPGDAGVWPVRPDPFSTCRPGFELRTYRTCRRVLMFHHFPGEAGVGRDCVVRSTDFTYADAEDPADRPGPVYTFLRAVTQTGWRRNGAGYDRRSLPPVEFDYSEPEVQAVVEEVDAASLEGLPAGLDGASWRWTDLHGEGLPGILSETAGAWHYKRNLSPLADGARFAPPETVALRPAAALGAGAEIMDLAGDGLPDVVVMSGPVAGFYEHDGAEGWKPFQPFAAPLRRDLRDPNLRFVDLDGDGRADVLITGDDALVWHPSRGEEGFGPAQRVARALDDETGPRVVFADAGQSIFLADLSGDGLTDIVRIRNGEVSYWPNLGHGRFGARVAMDDAPWFDHPDQFEPRRLRLADIDGSGTTDIVYLHRDGVRLYFNQSGNGWSPPRQLAVFPQVDELARILTVDLLGNGTACLVWSSPLPGEAGRPMRYLDLMGGRKPHLLVRSVNNLGAETLVDYAPSTRFYLQDRRDGRPWITRLPFPVHVVARVETRDRIARSRFVTRYAYHHGHFDGEEREFRGFGMVEQWDTEDLAALADGRAQADNIDAASHVPPVLTRSWFHTGVYLGRDHVSDHFAGLLNATDRGEYFREPGLSDAEARALLLPDTVLPEGLGLEDAREAARALKGAMLRQEVYAEDAGHPGATPEEIARALRPYSVREQNFTVRMLQPRAGNAQAVVFTHPRETLSYHYERTPADPAVRHGLTLEVDAHGTVLKEVAIGYGRRGQIRVVDPDGAVRQIANPGLAELDPADQARQTTTLLRYTETRTTNAIAAADAHRTPLPCETVSFELTGYDATGPAGRYQAADFVEPDPARPGRLRHRFAAPEVAHEDTAVGSRRRRPVERLRTLFRRDDLTGLLPLGEMQPLGLAGESYRLAFTPGLLARVFQRPRQGQPAEALLPVPADVLGGQAGDRGGYLQSQTLKGDGRFPATDPDDHWWMPSGRSFLSADPAATAAAELATARQHFFLGRRHRDPFGQDAFVDYDSRDLLLAETRDALGNRITVEANDYRLLQPRRISDPNRNRTEVAFDTLGLVVGTAVMGKPLPAPVEGDSLAGFPADLAPDQIAGLIDAADPRAAAAALLGDATTRIVYDLDRFRRSRLADPDDPTRWQPACVATLARETHVADPLPPGGLRIRLGFGYSDGFGREIQTKQQAEPGPLDPDDPQAAVVSPRWVGSGWTIHNNKGSPVRQYEPFFSATQGFEYGLAVGVSPVVFYDPAERVVATLYPNDSYEKVVFDPWRQVSYDANDTSAARNAETGDPRTDPDIGGYVAAYFRARPPGWQSWYARRIGGALGPDEQAAAERAAAHADTPVTVHVDALGRSVLTVARNRVVCPGHPQDGTEESLATRVELDIVGNQRAVRDALAEAGNPLGRIVMRYAYDMPGNRIAQQSMEAGSRWMLNDVAGNPIRAWDSRGHDFATAYDALRRPVAQRVRGTGPEADPRTLAGAILYDRIDYGEGLANAEALNLRTRIYRHFDPAGVATNARLDGAGTPVEAYDFKGNPLASTRQLVQGYATLADWQANPVLEDERFEARSRYDALNRPVQQVAPKSSLGRGGFNVLQPRYNEAELLERVDVWLEQPAAPAGLLDPDLAAPSPVGVANIDYDARGQRQRIDYRNGASTLYRHDPLTFRLARLETRRGAAAFPGDDPQPAPAGWPGRLVQNLHYTYDPAGNVTRIRDGAQQAVYFRNRRVDPGNDYVHDALYRLVQATGREQLGQAGAPIAHGPDDAGRIGLIHPGDGNALGRYVERYVYDAAGNFLQMQHRGSDPAQPGWTRAYDYLETSQIEDGSGGAAPRRSNRISRTTLNPGGAAPLLEPCRHDAMGNLVHMPHLGGAPLAQNLHWDFRGQLRRADLGGGGTAHCVCDGAGQRLRKVWEKSPGLIEERIYLGGFEIHRRHGAAVDGTNPRLERETLHLMDDGQRIALVETRTRDLAGTDPAPRQLIRYQFANHLGSASLELDDQARIISYEEYAPYGSTTYQAVRSATETARRYRFTGKERDEETGFGYHGARYYAPWLGRWTSADRSGMVDGNNLFQYVRGQPVSLIDPSGRDAAAVADAGRQLAMGGGAVTVGLLADDATVIGVVDDVLIPVAIIGAVVGLALWGGGTLLRGPIPTGPTKPEAPPRPVTPEAPPKPVTPEAPPKPVTPEAPPKPVAPEAPPRPAPPQTPPRPTDPTSGPRPNPPKTSPDTRPRPDTRPKPEPKPKPDDRPPPPPIPDEDTRRRRPRGRVAVDANALIQALDHGKLAELELAVAGRQIVIPPQAAAEYLSRPLKDPPPESELRVIMAERIRRLALFAHLHGAVEGTMHSEAHARYLQGRAQEMGRALSLPDARVASSVIRDNVHLLSRDTQLRGFMNELNPGSASPW